MISYSGEIVQVENKPEHYVPVYCNFIIYTIVNMESARFIFLETNITFEPACQRVSSLHLRFRRIQ